MPSRPSLHEQDAGLSWVSSSAPVWNWVPWNANLVHTPASIFSSLFASVYFDPDSTLIQVTTSEQKWVHLIGWTVCHWCRNPGTKLWEFLNELYLPNQLEMGEFQNAQQSKSLPTACPKHRGATGKQLDTSLRRRTIISEFFKVHEGADLGS